MTTHIGYSYDTITLTLTHKSDPNHHPNPNTYTKPNSNPNPTLWWSLRSTCNSKQWQCNSHTSLHSIPEMDTVHYNQQQTIEFTNQYVMVMKCLQCNPYLTGMFPRFQINKWFTCKMVCITIVTSGHMYGVPYKQRTTTLFRPVWIISSLFLYWWILAHLCKKINQFIHLVA